MKANTNAIIDNLIAISRSNYGLECVEAGRFGRYFENAIEEIAGEIYRSGKAQLVTKLYKGFQYFTLTVKADGTCTLA